MTITCPRCKTRLTLPDEKLKPEGTKFKCSKCGAPLMYKGKGRKTPQGGILQPTAPPSFSPAEDIAAAPQTTSAAREEHPYENIPHPPQEGPADLPHSGAAAGGAKPERGQEEVRKADDVSRAFPPLAPDMYSSGQETKAPPVKAIIGAVVGLLVLIVVAVFFFRSGDKTPGEQMKATEADKVATTPPPSGAAGPASTGASPENAAAGSPGTGGPAEQPASPSDAASSKGPAATTEEEAIEVVKRSDALLKRTSVESIVKIWTEKNSANYRVVGWQAKKTDEQKYLVSYTALDGDMPKGFYFELDAQSGAVVDLARIPELQKKYNIRYVK